MYAETVKVSEVMLYRVIARHLEEAVRRTHSGLDVQRLDVLPVLLQQGHQEVDSRLDVDEQLLFGHFNVTDGDSHAKNLLKLELDLGLDVVDLVLERLVVGGERRELAGLVQTRAQETRNLLNDGLGGKEVLVLLRELLDELLVLVELLQGFDVHGVDAVTSRFFAVLGVTEDAHLELRARNSRQLDGTVETLILLRIIVLQTNLKFNGLDKLARLLLGLFQAKGHALLEGIGVELAARARTRPRGRSSRSVA